MTAFCPVSDDARAAAIARLRQPAMHIDLLASAAINGMVVQSSRREEGGAPQGVPETVSGGIPQFFRRPDEPMDRVPDRYRNWMTDEQWREGCEAALAAVERGEEKMVSVPGAQLGIETASAVPGSADLAGRYVMDAKFAD